MKKSIQPFLEGRLVSLSIEEATFEDSTALFQISETNRKTIEKWHGDICPHSPEEAFFLLNKSYQSAQAQEQYAYLIKEKESKKIIGYISAKLPQKHIAQIAFWLDKENTVQYVLDSLQTLEKELFSKKVERLALHIGRTSKKEASFAIKAGFKLEGIAAKSFWNEKTQRFCDMAVYSKIRPTGFGKKTPLKN